MKDRFPTSVACFLCFLPGNMFPGRRGAPTLPGAAQVRRPPQVPSGGRDAAPSASAVEAHDLILEPGRAAAAMLCCLCFFLLSSAPANAAAPTFEKDIRPILKAHCFDCHGEGEKLKGGVDLRLQRLMLTGGDNGAVLVPGKPDKSLLFTMVESGEMPRREKKLTAEQIGLIKKWIAAGANVARPEPAEIGKGSARSFGLLLCIAWRQMS